jgi:uncharacterized phage protein (TIGR02220 family)
MARARNIKPGFYKNEDLAECSIWARYIFPGLWMLADREGRLEDRPKRIKGELLPFDGQDAEPLLRELTAKGFIVRYQKDGASYIQISKFHEHQSPHYSEKASVIKPPDSGSNEAIKGGSQPPDSLIPDSLNPVTALSGKPDVAKSILNFLNEKTGRRYRPVEANLKLIVARLQGGATEQTLRQVIAKKCREWAADEKMALYLRPATLFNATKFAQYEGELGASE